jgi:hypothetical protein
MRHVALQAARHSVKLVESSESDQRVRHGAMCFWHAPDCLPPMHNWSGCCAFHTLQGPADAPAQSPDTAGSVTRRRRAPPSGLRRSAGSAQAGQRHQGVQQKSDVQPQVPVPQQSLAQPPSSGADPRPQRRQAPRGYGSAHARQPGQDRPAANRQPSARTGQPNSGPSPQAHREAGKQHQQSQQVPKTRAAPGWVRQLQLQSVLTLPLPPPSKRLTQVPQPLPALQPEALASAAQLSVGIVWACELMVASVFTGMLYQTGRTTR